MRHDGLRTAGVSPGWQERILGRPGSARTGVMVAFLQVFIALEYAAWALSLPAGPGNRTTDTVLAAVLALAALGSLGLSRTRVRWWPTAMLALTAVAVLVGVATRLSPVGQSVLGVDLVLIAVVAAYLLPGVAFLVLLITMVAAYLVVALQRDLSEPFYPAALSVTIVVTSLLVADLVRLLQDAAFLDPLTRTLNRRGLAAQASVVHAISARDGNPTTVIVIDVDRFKAYNDRHGHAAGDAVLVALTTSWRSQLRDGDLLARTGGDEFVIVLNRSADSDALAVVDRLTGTSPFAWTHGITSWAPQETLDAAAARADADLVANKVQRRSASDDSDDSGGQALPLR